MTWQKPHWRERPNHTEGDLRPHEANVSGPPAYQCTSAASRRAGMEDARFFHRQANWCYQLAWQCFDLTVALKLNAMGNQHTAKARELRSQERKGWLTQMQKLVDPRSEDRVAMR